MSSGSVASFQLDTAELWSVVSRWSQVWFVSPGASPLPIVIVSEVALGKALHRASPAPHHPRKCARRANYGAYLMSQPELLASIIRAMRAAVSCPVFVKMRVFDDIDKVT